MAGRRGWIEPHRRDRMLTVGLALAWLLAFVLADVALGGGVVLVALFAVAPLIASAVLSWRLTGLIAFAALALAVASRLWDTGAARSAYVVRVIDVAVIGGAAVGIAVVRERRERWLAEVSAVADAAQAAVLPVLPDHLGPVLIAVRYHSATRAASIGGDLYDAVSVGDNVRVLVGDVRGKGLQAVTHAARTIRAFRLLAGAEADLAAVAVGMNAYLEPFFEDEDFVTAVLVEVTPDGQVRTVNCGHPTPLLRTAVGVRALACPDSAPLGFGGPYHLQRAAWQVGDRLLLHTDGLTEARDPAGNFFPTDQIVAALGAPTLDEALDQILASLHQHLRAGVLSDDLALVLLELQPAA